MWEKIDIGYNLSSQMKVNASHGVVSGIFGIYFCKDLSHSARDCSTLFFEMGSLLATCTPECTHSAKVCRKVIGSLITQRLVGMHNQMNKSSHCLHTMFYFLRV